MCVALRTFCLISVLVLVSSSDSYNILVLFPHYGKSHFVLYEDLFKQLAERGHNVTVISYFPQKKPLPNYRDVTLNLLNESTQSGLAFNDLANSRFKYYGGISILSFYAEKYCDSGFLTKDFQSFLKENNKYDLLLVQIFNSECFMGLAKKFEAPVVGK